MLGAAALANNTVRYGCGSGLIRFCSKGETECFEVADSGHIADPIAGRSHPSYEQLDGRGLWLVNQVCDLVQIRSSEAGTVVRLSMRVA